MTKDEFKKLYKGKLTIDLDEAWKQLKPNTRIKKPKGKKSQD